jgi:mannose-6-phosphate isomerase
VRPVVLPQNAVPRFYRGGAAIAALRGIENAPERTPEEWVGSTTTVFGEQELGLSRLPDGRLVRDAMAADPLRFFGPDHAAQRGADPCLLVKLLDAGERLPVHVHPDDALARELLASPYGKTEAWIVIATDGPAAAVHLGFREDLSAVTIERWVRDQDAAALLDALNPLEVREGDVLFVPAGTPHAIGEGLLIVELQEPSDLSILLEWGGFASGEDEASLGLGWDVALRCVDRSRTDPGRLCGERLPTEAESFFRAERLEGPPSATLERGFAILVVTGGAAVLHSEAGEPLRVERGDTVLVPWDAGACRLEGEVAGVACRPPQPTRGARRD